MISEKIEQALRQQTTWHGLIREQGQEVVRFAERVVDCFHSEGRLLTIGSGPLGSIADLIALQFLHRINIERPLLPALSLCQNPSLLAALVREDRAREYFVRQLKTTATREDIVLAFRCAGPDELVDEGLQAARQEGCTTAMVSLEGESGNGNTPDFLFPLGKTPPPRGIEASLFLGHLFCELVEGELFGI